MNKPNKSEMRQLANNLKALHRIEESLDSVYRRMAINGRDEKYVGLARRAMGNVTQAANELSRAVKDGGAQERAANG